MKPLKPGEIEVWVRASDNAMFYSRKRLSSEEVKARFDQIPEFIVPKEPYDPDKPTKITIVKSK